VPWHGPERDGDFPSLGGVLIDLYEEFLLVPSGDSYGKPLMLSTEQADLVWRFYALDPETGRFVFRRAALRRIKGWGKSPFAAAWLFGELVGPVVFDGWDADGEPVGKPHPTPWLQAAAVSEDQTSSTYFQLFDMLRESTAVDEFRLDLGKTRILLRDRPGRLEPVTSEAGTREGQPLTGAVLDETHLWTRSNGGVRLAATIRRNTAKIGGRTLETTNAYSPGEGSVAEATHNDFEKGAAGLLYDSREPETVVEDLADRPRLRTALLEARGDALWVDVERLVEECNDPSTDPADARRFYLNEVVKAAGRAIDPKLWAGLADPSRTPKHAESIGLGFDGSYSDDSTALIGCTADGFLFDIASWDRPANTRHWTVPRGEVHEAIRDAFARYKVGRMLCDPPLWKSELEGWAEEYGEDVVLEFPTNSTRRFAPACDRFSTAIRERRITHDGTSPLTAHVLNMARKYVRDDEPDDARTPFVFVKSTTGKIDRGVAAVLAFEAAETMPPKPKARIFSMVDLLQKAGEL
jgi:hypothetical protein